MAKVQAVQLVRTRRGCQLLEREDRYDVLLRGVLFGQLYWNLRGYVGYLPTPDGLKLDIGERGIGAYRRAVAELNREFAAAGRH